MDQPTRRIVGPLVIGVLAGLIGLWVATQMTSMLLAAIGFFDALAARFLANAIVGFLVGALVIWWRGLIGVLIGITPLALYIFAFDLAVYDRPQAFADIVVAYATTAIAFYGGRLAREALKKPSRRSIAPAAAAMVAALVLALAPSLAPGAISVGRLGWSQFSTADIGFADLGYSVGKPPEFNLGWDREGHVTFHGVRHQIGIAVATSEDAGTLDDWEREQGDFNQRLKWGAPDSVEQIEIAGRPALLLTYRHERGHFATEAFGVREVTDINAAPNPEFWEGRETFTLQGVVVDDGMAFVITSASEPGDEAGDRQLFLDVLSTFRLHADG